MDKNKNLSIGATFGIVIGLVYCALLFWRWESSASFIKFAVIIFISYIIILGTLFYEGFYRRKIEGGYIVLKDVFQTLFISVLILELFYSIYNFIHLKYIDPHTIERMKKVMIEMLDKAGDKVTDEQRADSLKRFDELQKATQIGEIIKSYFTSVAITGVFALIFSAIIKKKQPLVQENI